MYVVDSRWLFLPWCSPIVLIFSLLGEVAGYVGRAASASQPQGEWTLSPYIVQSVLPLIAPALFAASIYMELGRIVELVDGDVYLFVRRRWLTAAFVSGDVLSFLMQGSGIYPLLNEPLHARMLTLVNRGRLDGQQEL
jgi:hypothetical protein